MKLYSYWRSSASYRVRIALALKGLTPEVVAVNLLKGEQKSAEYSALNPEMRVPFLVDGEVGLAQSLAIMEYLEERYPAVPLLPVVPAERARVRGLALAVACDISPLNNLGALSYLVREFGIDEARKNEWQRHWMAAGFAALERAMNEGSGTGRFCHGAEPTIADCCLIPQLYNARRFEVELAPYPTLLRIETACNALPAFISAHPAQQPDAM